MKKNYITIKEAADILSVSPMTLRRWDKKRKLKADRHPLNNYRIYDRREIEKLRKKLEKPHSHTQVIEFDSKEINHLLSHYSIDEIERAAIQAFIENKRIKTTRNEFILNFINKGDFLTIKEIKDYFFSENLSFYNLRELIRFFELLIEPEWRKLNGAFYTPQFIVDYINNIVIEKNPHIKICDPACGSGAFLFSATELISHLNQKSIIKTIEENIYGVDIDSRSVKRTKLILSLLALISQEDKKEISFNINVGDSLNPEKFNWRKEFFPVFKKGGFDVVIGNPPYVKIQDFKPGLKENLIKNWETVSKGNFNLYFPFFEVGIKLLNDKGKLGYIVPNNYFTSLAGENLRIYLQKNKLIEEILDFNHLRVFKDVLTYTCITILSKLKKSKFKYKPVTNKNDFDKLKSIEPTKVYFSMLNPKKWRLLSKKDFLNIRKIESIGHPLGKVTRIRVGIATLDDKLYFIDGKKSKNGYYIKNNKNKKFLIEKSITRKIVKISTVNNEKEIKENKRRIIFPYRIVSQPELISRQSKKRKAEIIPENELQKDYPECYKYLLSIKDELKKRDKGKKSYPTWYAYGRSQSLTNSGPKLLTRTFSNKPNFMLDEDETSLFCNGYGIFYKHLATLQKILNSFVMDYYLKKTSYQIEGNYQCYQKNFIERFGIPNFSTKELRYLKKEKKPERIDSFLIKKYKIQL
ncbi:hypothetical protein ES703_02488 [subsurface metagenome]